MNRIHINTKSLQFNTEKFELTASLHAVNKLQFSTFPATNTSEEHFGPHMENMDEDVEAIKLPMNDENEAGATITVGVKPTLIGIPWQSESILELLVNQSCDDESIRMTSVIYKYDELETVFMPRADQYLYDDELLSEVVSVHATRVTGEGCDKLKNKKEFDQIFGNINHNNTNQSQIELQMDPLEAIRAKLIVSFKLHKEKNIQEYPIVPMCVRRVYNEERNHMEWSTDGCEIVKANYVNQTNNTEGIYKQLSMI